MTPLIQRLAHFYESVDGWFDFRDIYDAVLREAGDGAVFVEVGSWYGRSAAYMAVEIANSGKRIDFHCVDTWRGSVDTPWMAGHLAGLGGSGLHIFLHNLLRGGVSHLVHVIEKPSVAAAECFEPGSVDFVMIAAAHDFASVRADVRAWLPRVKPGGVMAGDDAGWPGVLIGVHETIPMSELVISNGGANWCYRKRRAERGTWTVRRETPARDYLVCIPCVNRADLLDRAVRSIPELWDAVVVVDETAEGLRPDAYEWVGWIAGVFRVADRGLSFTQTQNWMQAEARERGVEYLIFMHNDAECGPEAPARLLDDIRRHPDAGVTFTHYDAFCAFRMRAVDDVGPWDETFRWYFADNDYYRRLLLAGWRHSNVGGWDVVHHASQTLHSDGAIADDVAQHWAWHHSHYVHKWGGAPGHERHTIPYGGKPW